jgi:hypothetical protein
MGGTCSADGEERGVYRDLMRKPDTKRPLGRPRLRWEDNIRMDLQDVGCGGMQWRTEGRVWGVQTPRNSKVLPKLSRIPSSVEYTFVTT